MKSGNRGWGRMGCDCWDERDGWERKGEGRKEEKEKEIKNSRN